MKYALVLLSFLFYAEVYSQIEFKVSKIVIDNYIFDEDTFYDEDYTYGPCLTMTFLFTNSDSTELHLSPSTANISFSFKYRGKEYETKQIGIYELITAEKFVLNQNSSVEFKVPTYIFYTTDLLFSEERDYRSLLLCVVPTLCVHYKDKEVDICTSRIEEVELYNP